MRCLFFFCRPIRGISPGDARLRRVSLGSHIPPEDRKATRAARHFPGAGRGYSRQRRDSRVFGCFRAQSARLGSHIPLEDRGAACAARHSPGEERANSRPRRDSRVSIWFGIASPKKITSELFSSDVIFLSKPQAWYGINALAHCIESPKAYGITRKRAYVSSLWLDSIRDYAAKYQWL